MQEYLGYPEIQDEEGEFRRPIIEKLIKRPFRDAAFAKIVKDTYQQTCAVTGIKIVNGGGKAEVQAAHIMPISHDGPEFDTQWTGAFRDYPLDVLIGA